MFGAFFSFLKPSSAQKQKAASGVVKCISEQRLLDPVWYQALQHVGTNAPHISQDPYQYFHTMGWKQGDSPSAWFDTKWYLNTYPDVAQAGINPLLHYALHGAAEGRPLSGVLRWFGQLPAYQFVRPSEQFFVVVPVIGGLLEHKLQLLFQQYDSVKLNKPSGLYWLQCFDANGVQIVQGVTGLTWSDELAVWYRYLVQQSADNLKTDSFNYQLPANTSYVHIGIKPWRGACFEMRNQAGFVMQKPKAISAVKVEQTPVALKAANELSVAVILDEFSFNSFKNEFNAIALTPENWRQQFELHKPDLFFCESAWSGEDSVQRPWKGKIYASSNFARENRSVLLEILSYCRQQGIATLFWNKEDPTHYTDRKHDFVKTAALFDYVFTSAAECVEAYRQDYKLQHVFALPFATNPLLFNPLASGARSTKVVFAGSWYANHLERCEVMEQVLDALLASGYQPEIYDRYYGDNDPLHLWPDKYQPYIRPGLPHTQMPAVYKSSVLGLNFNTVTESSTMFARRVFELMSSHTLVVSNYAKGVAEMFGDLVVFADKNPDRLGALSEVEIDHIRDQALQLVLAEHTYAKRWRYMLQCIGFQVKADNEGITLVSQISNDAEAMAAISYFEQHFSRSPDCSLLLVVSAKVPDIEVAAFYQNYNRFGITVTAESFMQKHAMAAKYKPIQTPYFLLFNASKVIDGSWLQLAKLHLCYQTDYPLTPYSTKKYQLETAVSGATLLAHSGLFIRLYQARLAGEPIVAYTV